MANFLHREKEKRSRLRQLESNPRTIVHFCSPTKELAIGEKAVLNGRNFGEVLALGFVVTNFRVCKPQDVTPEEFSYAPDIVNSQEKLAPSRLRSWRLTGDRIQVVRLERR
jgi:hypothetical protein